MKKVFRTEVVKRIGMAALAATLAVPGTVGVLGTAKCVQAVEGCVTVSPKVSLQKNLQISEGECRTLQVNNLKKNSVRWSVVSGSGNIHLKTVKKKAEISGIKAGRAKIMAKVGKKKLYCKIKVTKQRYYVGENETGTEENTVKKPLSGNSINLMESVSKKTAAKKQPSQKFSYATADFSMKLLKNLMKKDQTGQVLISPDSILTALAMLENGAEGATLTQMQNMMGKGISQSDYNAYLSTLNQSLTSSKGVVYRVADSIWKKSDSFYQLNPLFLEKNKSYYDAQIYEAPFDDSTVSDINNWCSNHTDGLIPTIINDLPQSSDSQTAFVLLNAVLFEGKWNTPYSDGQVSKEKFTTESGKKQSVSMMSEKTGSYIKINGGTGFIKSYNNTRFAFVGMLPKKGQSLNDFVNGLTGKDFVIACKSRRYMTTYTKMPEFSYDYSISLKDSLKTLGMKDAFSGQANFGKMVLDYQPDNVGLCVSDVLHKTHIDVDRNGTRAAAATAVMMAETTSIETKTQNIFLNRPFAYAIIDVKTGIPLFLGTVKTI